jgi:hypothetical protein
MVDKKWMMSFRVSGKYSNKMMRVNRAKTAFLGPILIISFGSNLQLTLHVSFKLAMDLGTRTIANCKIQTSQLPILPVLV